MKRSILSATLILACALPAGAMARPTAGPEAGPGCFGQWRAGSIAVQREQSDENSGQAYFSQRKGDNARINAENRAECAALSD